MARPKGSRNGVRKIVPLCAVKYLFSVGDIILYKGGLYEAYRNTEATVESRSKRKSFEYYEIRFGDGKLMEVRGNWIEKKVEKLPFEE